MTWLKRNWNLVAAILFVVAAAYFRGIEDVRLFHPEENIYYDHLVVSGDTSSADWYWGGVEKYNSAVPWLADFWHRMKHLEIFCWASSIALASRKWWLLAVYPLFTGFFTLFYHYTLLTNPGVTFWEVLFWMMGAGLFFGTRLKKKSDEIHS